MFVRTNENVSLQWSSRESRKVELERRNGKYWMNGMSTWVKGEIVGQEEGEGEGDRVNYHQKLFFGCTRERG